MAADLSEALQKLRQELDCVNASIFALDALQQSSASDPSPSNRGRKSVGSEERQEVSARMKQYWASRRLAQ